MKKLNQSHSAKSVGPFRIFCYPLLQNIKTIEGGPLETLKRFRKKSHSGETKIKNRKSPFSPFSLVGFCMLRFKNERGPYAVS